MDRELADFLDHCRLERRLSDSTCLIVVAEGPRLARLDPLVATPASPGCRRRPRGPGTCGSPVTRVATGRAQPLGQSSPGRSAMLSSELCPVDSTRPRLSFIDISGMRSLRSSAV
jgi:hypothetical protein